MDPDPRGQLVKDPPDPYPQHCFLLSKGTGIQIPYLATVSRVQDTKKINTCKSKHCQKKVLDQDFKKIDFFQIFGVSFTQSGFTKIHKMNVF
jgi:hypothetical protein